MISCEDKKRLQELICQEFPEYSKEKREQMVEALVKKEGAYVAFCECIGKHVSKIGVKLQHCIRQREIRFVNPKANVLNKLMRC